jgi:CBS domain containing-hemolysin-like protein
MALVVDDQGRLSGLVTTEDLIEELVGDIMSEDDVPGSSSREPSGTILVQGWAAVRKVNRDLHLDLPVGRDRTTIAAVHVAARQSRRRANASQPITAPSSRSSKPLRDESDAYESIRSCTQMNKVRNRRTTDLLLLRPSPPAASLARRKIL